MLKRLAMALSSTLLLLLLLHPPLAATTAAAAATSGTMVAANPRAKADDEAALFDPTTTTAPRSFFIANDGSDAASGGDAAHPWQTFARLSNEILHGGDSVHLASGDTWSEPLVLTGVEATCVGSHMRGDFERIIISSSSNVSLDGWVVDPLLPQNGTAPVNVRVTIDGTGVADVVANVYRGDLVTAGVAPNPEHGIKVVLGASAVASLQHGVHRIAIMASSSAAQCGSYSWRLPGPMLDHPIMDKCVCDGALCECPESHLPVRVISTGATANRPRIMLNGSGTGITLAGLDSVSVAGIEISNAAEGIVAIGPNRAGSAEVVDCVFRGVWNRSSIGQTSPHKNRDCTSGWSTTVSLGGFANASVSGCLFDDVDVAFLPRGGLDSVRFLGNTLTRANGNTVLMVGKTSWLIDSNVFSRDSAPRFFMCGTTDIMIGGLGTVGTISNNEIGFRGEHPASPDGCGIDFEGGSDGVIVSDNVIHDSYGAGIMVFGLSDSSRNISNSKLLRNVFLRNGAVQTSDDRGEIAFMEHGSTGSFIDNIFYADSTDVAFVFNERTPGTLDFWNVSNNTIHGIDDIPSAFADTPAVRNIMYAEDTGFAHVSLESRDSHKPLLNRTVLYSLDGSWPMLGSKGTIEVVLPPGGNLEVVVRRTSALNARFIIEKTCDPKGCVDGFAFASLTMTLVVDVPAPGTRSSRSNDAAMKTDDASLPHTHCHGSTQGLKF